MNFITWLIYAIKNRWAMFDIRELTVGGHCGCCGAWVDKAIVEKGWKWTLYEKCERE